MKRIFKNENKLKPFSIKYKLREFIASNLYYRMCFKELFRLRELILGTNLLF